MYDFCFKVVILMSSHLAVFSSLGLVRQRKVLEDLRIGFLGNSQSQIPARPIVYESWLRSLQLGVDPQRRQTAAPLKSADLEPLINGSELYQNSTAALNDLLIEITGTKHLLTLTDSQGKILFLGGDYYTQRQAEKINFVPGSNWSEEAIGTNAIGTCLKAGYPVQIFAAEHFCEGINNWVCSSAPIHDPVSKEILGVIDLTGFWKQAQAHTLGMAMLAAKVIEHKLYDLAASDRAQLLEWYSSLIARYPQNGVIVLDAGLNPIQANRYARSFFNEVTGKEFETSWPEQNFSHFLPQTDSVQQNNEYELFFEQFGISVLIQEIYRADKRIGFILILRPSGPRVPARLPQRNSAWDRIVGKSNNILAAITKCNLVAQANVPVLLLGESGSGKELFAQAIHQVSTRRNGPFVALNCGAIPKELIASELFGYDPGTFTGAVRTGKKGKFEEAHLGTLFLDEIGEMSPELQVHLLRVLQEREVVRLGGSKPIPVDVRIIAATHQNLEQLILKELFRVDLYYRLNVASINIPPLRERRDDIPLLIEHFLELFARKHKKPSLKLERQLQDFLVNIYAWPGNVRELQNTLEHAVLFCSNHTITKEDIPQSFRQGSFEDSYKAEKTSPNLRFTNLTPSAFSGSNEKAVLINLLQESGGNLSEVARHLGVARTTLYRHLAKHGVKGKSWDYSLPLQR